VKETEARAVKLEIYEGHGEADAITFDDIKGFRFTTRHLLIATAVLALIMAMVRISGCNGLFFAGLAALAFGWWYVWNKERTEERARVRRRLEAEARLAKLSKQAGATAPTVRMAGLEPAAEEPPSEQPAFRFTFSVKQVFWALAIASLVMALASTLGSEYASWMLGIIAVIGLVIQLMGFELPGIMLFSWWILLVLYLLFSVFAIFAAGAGP
jgi:hypothetical protein